MSDAKESGRIAVLFNKPRFVESLEDVVSAHIQLLAYTSKCLNESGLDCLTTTPKLPQGMVLPDVMRELDFEEVFSYQVPTGNRVSRRCCTAKLVV